MKRLLLLLGLLALPCFGQVLNLKSDSATFGSASATTKLDNQGNYNQTNNTTGAWILLGTNAHVRIVDQYGSRFEIWTNTLRWTRTNGDYVYSTNGGDFYISGTYHGGGLGGSGPTQWPASAITNAPWLLTESIFTAAFGSFTTNSFGSLAWLSTVTSNNLSGHWNWGQIDGVPAFITSASSVTNDGTLLRTNGDGSGLTGLQASGISTNGGITGQVMINGGNGTVLWTNNQSIVAAGTGETTETMSTNPVTGQVTYTSNVNTNQFLGAGVGWRDGVNVTNINASANGLVTNTPAGIAAAGGNTNLSSAYITTNGATTSGYVPTATGASGAYNWQAPSSLSGGSYTFTTNCFAGFPSDIVQASEATISFPTVNRMYGMVWYNNKNLVINRVIFACGAVTNGFNVGVSIYSWPAGVKLLDTGAISPVVGLNTNTLSPSMTTLTNGFYTVGWTAGTNAALTFIGIQNFQNNITPFTSFGLFNYNGAQGTNGLTLGSFPTSAQSTTASAMVPILYFMP